MAMLTSSLRCLGAFSEGSSLAALEIKYPRAKLVQADFRPTRTNQQVRPPPWLLRASMHSAESLELLSRTLAAFLEYTGSALTGAAGWSHSRLLVASASAASTDAWTAQTAAQVLSELLLAPPSSAAKLLLTATSAPCEAEGSIISSLRRSAAGSGAGQPGGGSRPGGGRMISALASSDLLWALLPLAPFGSSGSGSDAQREEGQSARGC
eukprot:CAMPEP_0115143690 /NCGR_PEP_ID=MMETSP0227-20121206/60943_1 /TAXON_ID=89957 /ORGANISM="Polarella glacialis, Strain CCMP 1383" /LENGTH=209 /DNA_ID=CAMNT_0002552611 /DNA_START=214 /DNA_END=843 /DNA_ORIENTATION=+